MRQRANIVRGPRSKGESISLLSSRTRRRKRLAGCYLRGALYQHDGGFVWNPKDWCCLPSCGSKQTRSEEHTSELQSLTNLVCRLLLEKKKKVINQIVKVFLLSIWIVVMTSTY